MGIDKSLIIMENKIGPSLVPWGTPALTKNHSESDCPILKRCLRFERKLIIYGIRHGQRLSKNPRSKGGDVDQVNLDKTTRCASGRGGKTRWIYLF